MWVNGNGAGPRERQTERRHAIGKNSCRALTGVFAVSAFFRGRFDIAELRLLLADTHAEPKRRVAH